MRFAAIIMNWLHMMAGFTWLGGLIFVNVVLSPVVQPKGIPPEFVRIMGMERFRYFAWGSIGVIILTGAFNMFRGMAESAGQPNPLFVGALLTKLVIVSIMIVLTVVNSVLLRRRLVNAKPAPGGPSPEIKKIGDRLVLFSRINLALGSVVLLMVAIMRGAE